LQYRLLAAAPGRRVVTAGEHADPIVLVPE
jgi:hypothetical protein